MIATTPAASRLPWWVRPLLVKQQLALGRLPRGVTIVNSPGPSRGGTSEEEVAERRRQAARAQAHREAVRLGMEDQAGNVLATPSVADWLDVVAMQDQLEEDLVPMDIYSP